MTQQTMPLLTSQGLSVADEYRIERHPLNGRPVEVVVENWNTRGKDCWPLNEQHLVEDFADVTNTRSLRQFNERYGLLGYHRLHAAEMRRRNETWRGDPVQWALAHARVAAAILGLVEIINDLRTGARKTSSSLLVRLFVKEFREMDLVMTPVPWGKSNVCELEWTTPEERVWKKRFSSRWGNDPIGTAYYVVSWVLNQYVNSIRVGFASVGYAHRFFRMTKSPPYIGPELRWSCLFEVIYWRLAECIGGALRQCPRCGVIFPTKTVKKGRPAVFCSKGCGDAARQKRKRDREKASRTARTRRKGKAR